MERQGPLPTMCSTRKSGKKDIQYSSRTRAITDVMQHQQRNRHMLRELLELIPEKERLTNPGANRLPKKPAQGNTPCFT